MLVQSPLPGETYAPDQRVFVALHVSSSFVPQKPFIEIAVDGAGATRARLKANAPHQRHTSAAEEVCAADEADVPLLGFYSQLPPLAEGSHTVTLGLAGLAEPVTIGFHVGSASYAHTVNASRSRATRFPPFSTDECISRSAKGACCALTNVCLVACGESSSGTAGGAAMPCATGDSLALAYFQSPLVPPFRGEASSVASAHTRIRGPCYTEVQTAHSHAHSAPAACTRTSEHPKALSACAAKADASRPKPQQLAGGAQQLAPSALLANEARFGLDGLTNPR